MTGVQKPTRVNHFVPQAFQKFFKNPQRSGEIWRYDKQTNEVSLIPIEIFQEIRWGFGLNHDAVDASKLLPLVRQEIAKAKNDN